VRKALNENPVAQIAVLGVLAVVVAFLMMTKVMHRSSGSASTEPTATGAPAEPADSTTPGAMTTPGATPPAAAGAAAPTGEFEAGPGLPAPVVNAYAEGRTVVLLVVRNGGIEDGALRNTVERLRSRSDVALFVAPARHVARYARIAEGVNVHQVPALVVMRPRHLSHGMPTASVSYGFRGADSVEQALRDVLYKGPSNLPYYPK
jgi:hypothetical protein